MWWFKKKEHCNPIEDQQDKLEDAIEKNRRESARLKKSIAERSDISSSLVQLDQYIKKV